MGAKDFYQTVIFQDEEKADISQSLSDVTDAFNSQIAHW